MRCTILAHTVLETSVPAGLVRGRCDEARPLAGRKEGTSPGRAHTVSSDHGPVDAELSPYPLTTRVVPAPQFALHTQPIHQSRFR